MGKERSLSIILVTKNRASIFERSLKSILAEVESEFPSTEVLVIDGGSSDATVDIIKKYEHRLAFWLSEPDSGVAEAGNKGAAHAKGDLIRFVGDDDEFIPGRLKIMMQVIDKLPEYDIIAGHNDLFLEENDGSKTYVPQARYAGDVSNKKLQLWGSKAGYLIPEVCFFRKSAFNQVGGFDLSIKWWGFLDLFLRMSNQGMRFFVVPFSILISYQHPLSDTRSNLYDSKFWNEFNQVIRKNISLIGRFNRWMCYRKPFVEYCRCYSEAAKRTKKALNTACHALGQKTGIHPRLYLKKLWKI